MKLKSSKYFAVAVLVIALIFFGLSFTYNPLLEMKLIPLIISGIVIILAAIQLKNELSKNGQETVAIKSETGKTKPEMLVEDFQTETVSKSELRRYIISLGWICSFFLLTYLIGFIAGILLFVFLYLKLHGKGWLISGVITVISTALLYLIFVTLLKIELFSGYIVGILKI